ASRCGAGQGRRRNRPELFPGVDRGPVTMRLGNVTRVGAGVAAFETFAPPRDCLGDAVAQGDLGIPAGRRGQKAGITDEFADLGFVRTNSRRFGFDWFVCAGRFADDVDDLGNRDSVAGTGVVDTAVLDFRRVSDAQERVDGVVDMIEVAD